VSAPGGAVVGDEQSRGRDGFQGFRCHGDIIRPRGGIVLTAKCAKHAEDDGNRGMPNSQPKNRRTRRRLAFTPILSFPSRSWRSLRFKHAPTYGDRRLWITFWREFWGRFLGDFGEATGPGASVQADGVAGNAFRRNFL
jgi:hypothetical protein